MSSQKPQDRLRELLSDDLTRVNDLIADRMASEHAPRIPEVTAHLINAGGKRLRPMLTLAAANMCNYDGPYHVHLAATVEFIHTATLLHDDVVDESEQRRGRPTANLLWDNQSSVLVGDYLFSRAFQLMVETDRLDVLGVLANASAVIAEGEVLQLSVARNLKTTQETYIKVIRGKTAALFAAACKVGGMIANAAEDQCRALNNYGDALGISFQMIDDLLDYTGEAKSLGKNVGDDFRERKLTLPLIKAVEKADDKERKFWTRVIEKGDQQDGDLEQAMEIFNHHGTLEETKAEAEFWVACAHSALEELPASETRDLLRDICDYILSRTV